LSVDAIVNAANTSLLASTARFIARPDLSFLPNAARSMAARPAAPKSLWDIGYPRGM
jgi:hypothetical protein